jgi:HD-GYP domain-containing protein (c-di-GMP phosphodiesterase class II)
VKDATVELAAEALRARDPVVASHSERVGELAVRLTQQVNLGDRHAELIRVAGLLHDLGLIGIPDSILNKPGPLGEDEWEVMRRHPDIGADLIRWHPALAELTLIVRHHHERWDGSGYPAGLGGEAIPIGARVVAVAESFDAMTNERIYRTNPLSSAEAIQDISERSGSWYDPNVVEALLLLYR